MKIFILFLFSQNIVLTLTYHQVNVFYTNIPLYAAINFQFVAKDIYLNISLVYNIAHSAATVARPDFLNC